ncbi:hypothetical protein [Bradyrhizobium sp. CCGUVB14]|uniref:hypothetical protein n=1 Tax=Bradyrhizobium sp. CCGUVB14 TaxID=2949628 RepID=UPI0020B2704F|nr:hypothetical protein [Bradyrhizobium sp. CCGUVB14]MCP3439807.1 hypothetical protein [Bradyrhizobium sp. CCGUVB14]
MNDNDGPRPTGKLDPSGQAEQEREHGHARACMPSSARSDHSNKSETEHCSRDGAMALAKRLEAYWHGEGYPSARFWAEPIEERFEKVGTYELYRVVCNLVNGLPPRYKHER